MPQNKPELRQLHHASREEMSPADMKHKSRIICLKLLEEVDWTVIESLHIYRPIIKFREVNTADFIDQLSLEHSKIHITKGSQDKQSAVPQDKYDAVVLPVLAFDKNRQRLGRGGGWYDRFLAGQPQALKIGLAYESNFEAAEIGHEAHDIPLDKIVTEVKTY